MVTDSEQDEKSRPKLLQEFDSTALFREPGRALWECTHDPDLGWIVLGVDRRTQYPMFSISLSEKHQNAEYARAVCEALARIYNRTDERA